MATYLPSTASEWVFGTTVAPSAHPTAVPSAHPTVVPSALPTASSTETSTEVNVDTSRSSFLKTEIGVGIGCYFFSQ